MDAREFEWESQLRFYWVREPDELVIRQCTGSFGYGYEYMGLNGRLVITPLTDRIYLTLTQVWWLFLLQTVQCISSALSAPSCA